MTPRAGRFKPTAPCNTRTHKPFKARKQPIMPNNCHLSRANTRHNAFPKPFYHLCRTPIKKQSANTGPHNRLAKGKKIPWHPESKRPQNATNEAKAGVRASFKYRHTLPIDARPALPTRYEIAHAVCQAQGTPRPPRCETTPARPGQLTPTKLVTVTAPADLRTRRVIIAKARRAGPCASTRKKNCAGRVSSMRGKPRATWLQLPPCILRL